MGGHFSAKRLYKTLVTRWYWEKMYADVEKFVKSCPDCMFVTGSGRRRLPPLKPIPVQRPFQIVGVDIMELPKTRKGNRYVVVFQDFFTKWLLVFPVPDQKTHRLTQLLVEEVIPLFGVPEALLSDRGANLLSHLMLDVCKLLGTKKLNTTAYHPQCDGMVERFNRTLKTALRKHAIRFGNQWDTYLSGILWAYRNSPHDSTGEKPSFLLFGMDCRSPTEAALLPPEPLLPTKVDDYRQQLILSLSSARELAAETNREAQKRYKHQFDKKSSPHNYKKGDWVLVRFPHEETGKNRKLSQPWHGPYRVVDVNNPDLTVSKVYFPQDGVIQIHQTRVTPCCLEFPSGSYFYGRKKCSTQDYPQWIDDLATRQSTENDLPDPEDQPDASKEGIMSESSLPNQDLMNECDQESTTEESPPGSYNLRPRNAKKSRDRDGRRQGGG